MMSHWRHKELSLDRNIFCTLNADRHSSFHKECFQIIFLEIYAFLSTSLCLPAPFLVDSLVRKVSHSFLQGECKQAMRMLWHWSGEPWLHGQLYRVPAACLSILPEFVREMVIFVWDHKVYIDIISIFVVVTNFPFKTEWAHIKPANTIYWRIKSTCWSSLYNYGVYT